MNDLLVCKSMHSCLTVTDDIHHLMPFYDLSIPPSNPSLSRSPHISPSFSGACWVSAIYPVVSAWHAATPEWQFNMALLKHMCTRAHKRSAMTCTGAIECLRIRPWLRSRDGEAECYHKQKKTCFYIKHKKGKKYFFHLFFGTDMYTQLWIHPCTQR